MRGLVQAPAEVAAAAAPPAARAALGRAKQLAAGAPVVHPAAALALTAALAVPADVGRLAQVFAQEAVAVAQALVPAFVPAVKAAAAPDAPTVPDVLAAAAALVVVVKDIVTAVQADVPAAAVATPVRRPAHTPVPAAVTVKGRAPAGVIPPVLAVMPSVQVIVWATAKTVVTVVVSAAQGSVLGGATLPVLAATPVARAAAMGVQAAELPAPAVVMAVLVAQDVTAATPPAQAPAVRAALPAALAGVIKPAPPPVQPPAPEPVRVNASALSPE